LPNSFAASAGFLPSARRAAEPNSIHFNTTVNRHTTDCMCPRADILPVVVEAQRWGVR
jgi:hypothetical protein